MIMCGMSACFSALFGTPIAAAVFSMEVISVGVMYYAALVPCVVSALTAQSIAKYFGIAGTHFALGELPDFTIASRQNAFNVRIICLRKYSVLRGTAYSFQTLYNLF